MSGHAGHGIRVCQYGYVHNRCRCPDDTEIRIACDREQDHADATYQPKHAREDDR